MAAGGPADGAAGSAAGWEAMLRYWPQSLIFILAWGFLLRIKHWPAGVATLAVAGGIGLLYWLLRRYPKPRTLLAYATFFLTPLLTATGQIGVLTGFGGSSLALPWLGVSFVSAALAVHILQGKLNLASLIWHIAQPLRWNSGPCALPHAAPLRAPGLRRLARTRIWLGWIVLGAFYYGVLAAGFAPLLSLKESSAPLDIVAFAIVFEAYVYFNFSGISFMVLGLLNLAGVKTMRNFNTPFAARDIIGYWQRWHMSLSALLKILFFQPLKSRFGMAGAVFAVFIGSALWHGISGNFVLWGAFHAAGWLLTYYLARATRLGRWRIGLNALLFPLIVLFGRLIFSEGDTSLLWLKCQHLLQWGASEAAWLPYLTLDGKTWLRLTLALLCLLAEVCLRQRFRRYKLLRYPWATLSLVLLCLLIGNTGLGGVYGAR
jgi:hypothetical protein